MDMNNRTTRTDQPLLWRPDETDDRAELGRAEEIAFRAVGWFSLALALALAGGVLYGIITAIDLIAGRG